MVVDGVHNKILYGKAPGNVLYRAGALVVGMAVGNLLLVHGTAFAFQAMALASDSDNDAWALLLVPPILGILAIAQGYRLFRFGEEVEHLDREARKAVKKEEGFSLTSLLGDGINLNQEVKKWLE